MKVFYIFIFVLFFAVHIGTAFSQNTLCEQFSDTTFPPNGWSLQYSGTRYWHRSNHSAFNIGTGSAFYNMWSAPLGTRQSLTSPVFQPTIAGDSLILDMAYTAYPVSPPFSPDSLIILASTNGGAAFVTVSNLGPADMITCPGPTQNCQTLDYWVKRKYWLPAGTNKIQFLGISGFGNDVYLDSICILSHPLGIVNNNEIAREYALMQNYPNPFNPSTNIKFSIAKSSYVKLTITDALGRLITTLVNEFKQAGNYSVDFDASRLSSGVYFYHIESRQAELLTNSFSETKKMLLVK
jgi:hypothetical protein